MISRRTLLAAPLALPGIARAQGFPNRPIRVIVGFAPGGQSDTVMRLLAPKMQEVLGQSIIIENRAGAGGSIAGNAVAQSPADGYTLLFDSFGFLVVPFVIKGISPDHNALFTPIGQAVSAPYVVVVKKDFPARTFADFIAYVKQNPGVNYGSPGVGSPGHFAGELLIKRAGIKLEHTPYRGGAESARDIASGALDSAIGTANSFRPLIESGRAIGLALTSGERRGSLANLPTIAESGFPGFDFTSWNALFAPVGTPAPVIARLEAALAAAVADGPTREKLILGGSDPAFEDAATFGARLRRERDLVRQIVAEAGIKPE